MVRKWSTGPISLSYTTPLRPKSPVGKTGSGELSPARACAHQRRTRGWSCTSTSCTRATSWPPAASSARGGGAAEHARRRRAQLPPRYAPTHPPTHPPTAYSDATVANRDGRGFGWEVGHAAVTRRPPISLYTMVARTEGYAYDVGVRDWSIVQGPFSVAPCQTPRCVRPHPPTAYSDATVASRNVRVWHGATENGP
jgi:hypothetical protein